MNKCQQFLKKNKVKKGGSKKKMKDRQMLE
jgi:hypothetical protein